VLEARDGVGGAPIIPLASVAITTAPARELAMLRAAGELMPALAGGKRTTFGAFYEGTIRRGDTPSAAAVFSLSDRSIRVGVDWSPSERIRGSAVLQVIDAENNVIGASPPRKVNFNKGSAVRSAWDVPMVKAPGLYRIDVTVDGRPYWRAFFRVNPRGPDISERNVVERSVRPRGWRQLVSSLERSRSRSGNARDVDLTREPGSVGRSMFRSRRTRPLTFSSAAWRGDAHEW
jgi:hypothetical protein